jgi:UDPglucose 6-dehydrogenase
MTRRETTGRRDAVKGRSQAPAAGLHRAEVSTRPDLTAYDPNRCAPGPAHLQPIHLVNDAYLATKDAEAIVVLTEAPQFRKLDWTPATAVISPVAPSAVR